MSLFTTSSERRDFFKLGRRLLLLLPILAVISWVNYSRDPEGLYRDQRNERNIADILIAGRNIGSFYNYNERLVQLYWIQGMKETPDVVILGSSRSMQIGPELFPGKIVRNHSVSGGAIQDYTRIFFAYIEKDRLPKTVVLGLDPWSLNGAQSGFRSSVAGNHDLDKIKSKLGLRPGRRLFPGVDRRLPNLVSLGYFQISIREYLKPKMQGGYKFYPTDEQYATLNTRLADGTISYGRLDKARMARASTNLNNRDYSIDSEAAELLDAFLRYLIANDVQTIIYIPPLRPKTLKQYINTLSLEKIETSERYFRDVASRYKIPVIGSVHSELFGLIDADFYDNRHLTREGTARIFLHKPPMPITSTAHQ